MPGECSILLLQLSYPHTKKGATREQVSRVITCVMASNTISFGIPKYWSWVLKDRVSREVHNCINIFSSQLECEIVDRNIQSALTKNLKKSKDRLISNESLGYNSFLPSKRARTQPPFRGQKQNQVLRAWILYFFSIGLQYIIFLSSSSLWLHNQFCRFLHRSGFPV